jgi:uncharacterized pyridoxamine 5'-phosphate oxidase family protein
MRKVFVIVLVIAAAAGGYFAVRSIEIKRRADAAQAMMIENNKKAADFLRGEKFYFIATIDENNRPRVRPFGSVEIIDGKIAFCTGGGKNVYKQIMANGWVEISAYQPEIGKWIRISGKLIDSTADAAREVFFANEPNLRGLYNGRENELRVLIFDGSAAVSFQDFADNIEKFDI